MKRRELLNHLERHNCQLLREGGNHSIWENLNNGKRTAVPRHKEIIQYTADKICKQLEVPKPI
jgi:mRNA interferase HicA